jgi:hypothetical protein
VGDREKLVTYLNSALKVLSGLDIFPRGTKKKLNFVDQCNYLFSRMVYLGQIHYPVHLTRHFDVVPTASILDHWTYRTMLTIHVSSLVTNRGEAWECNDYCGYQQTNKHL